MLQVPVVITKTPYPYSIVTFAFNNTRKKIRTAIPFQKFYFCVNTKPASLQSVPLKENNRGTFTFIFPITNSCNFSTAGHPLQNCPGKISWLRKSKQITRISIPNLNFFKHRTRIGHITHGSKVFPISSPRHGKKVPFT
ncbi:hypothetical protein V8G54_034459 [Vigna mungo]|uniref:Uncharacterized protein n=1 Tax=Vigna mungo TaxID=3915 RepID=A0AAQ3MQP5_VIGMU